MPPACILKLTKDMTIITHGLALVIGFVLGALVYRNNTKTAAQLVVKAKAAADAVK